MKLRGSQNIYVGVVTVKVIIICSLYWKWKNRNRVLLLGMLVTNSVCQIAKLYTYTVRQVYQAGFWIRIEWKAQRRPHVRLSRGHLGLHDSCSTFALQFLQCLFYVVYRTICHVFEEKKSEFYST